MEFAPIEQNELNEEEPNKKPIDALVVFGGGIISDEGLEKMQIGSELIGHSEKGWRLPLVARLRVLGATELYLRGEVEDVILTGGKVAKEKGIDASEAELMKKYFLHTMKKRWSKDLKGQGFSETDIDRNVQELLNEAEKHILLEDKATNTIENFAHTINLLTADKEKYANIAFMSNGFHIDRIVKLAKKFLVEGQGISSEPEISQRDNRYKKIADIFLDKETNKKYYEEVIATQDKEDRRISETRFFDPDAADKGEKRWSRGLDDIPAYWLPNVAVMESTQLREVLAAENVLNYLSENGIQVDQISDDELVRHLKSIPREIPPAEWGEE